MTCIPSTSTQRSSQAVEEDSEMIFARLLRSIEKKHLEVKEMIRGEERKALGQTKKLLERLNQQITEHRREEAVLEKLSNTNDHVYFLQVNDSESHIQRKKYKTTRQQKT